MEQREQKPILVWIMPSSNGHAQSEWTSSIANIRFGISLGGLLSSSNVISHEPISHAHDNLLAGARKAVRHGYKVYILPNPKGVRSADYIFERKGVYKMFDLKTITGTGSIGSRLEESIGQTNRVFLNLATTYPTNRMATEIKQYFEANDEALEVLVAVGKKMVPVERNFVTKRTFFKEFRKAVEQ